MRTYDDFFNGILSSQGKEWSPINCDRNTTSYHHTVVGTTSTAQSSLTVDTISATYKRLETGPMKGIFFELATHFESGICSIGPITQRPLDEPLEGKKGDYFNSGDVMDGMEIPTIITNMPRRGICIYQCHDADLSHWTPLAEKSSDSNRYG